MRALSSRSTPTVRTMCSTALLTSGLAAAVVDAADAAVVELVLVASVTLLLVVFASNIAATAACSGSEVVFESQRTQHTNMQLSLCVNVCYIRYLTNAHMFMLQAS
jgi:hypothetical protein